MPGFIVNIFQAALGLLGLSLLVFIHEFGHFWVAKKNGVTVRTFSIGFGKKLFKWTKNGTEYCISAIPFGGYVAMAGENPNEMQTRGPMPGDFAAMPVRIRAAIALAGPMANIIFAYFLLVALYMYGVQEPVKHYLAVGLVEENSVAEQAGLMPGDTILSVDGKLVEGWNKFRELEGVSINTPIELLVQRDGVKRSVIVKPEEYENMGVGYSGLHPATKIIASVSPTAKSPAGKAGIQAGDTLYKISGRLVSSVRDVQEAVNASKGKPIPIVMRRSGSEVTAMVQPEYDAEYDRYMIQLPLSRSLDGLYHTVQRGFVESFQHAGKESLRMATSIFVYIGKIFEGKVKVKALSGPLGIVPIIGLSFFESPVKMFMLLALISINLGVMNLLPLAITDGGVLLFLGIEAIRKKPLSIALQGKIQQVATLLFIMLFLYITFNDLGRFSMFFPN